MSQKQQSLFYAGPTKDFEEEKEGGYQPNSRRYSIEIMNFDYDTSDSSDSYQIPSNSFPPKNQRDIFIQKKLTNVKFPSFFCLGFFLTVFLLIILKFFSEFALN